MSTRREEGRETNILFCRCTAPNTNSVKLEVWTGQSPATTMPPALNPHEAAAATWRRLRRQQCVHPRKTIKCARNCTKPKFTDNRKPGHPNNHRYHRRRQRCCCSTILHDATACASHAISREMPKRLRTAIARHNLWLLFRSASFAPTK